MLLPALAFLAGVCTLQWCAELPPGYSYILAVIPLLLLRLPVFRYLAVFVLGFFWAALRAEAVLTTQLDPGLENRTLLVEGTVLDLPRLLPGGRTRFPFRVERLDTGAGWVDFGARVRLSWYATDIAPAPGERWQLAVRLKRPHGFANPGGFDYERWLFQQRIRATGYVRKDMRNQRIAAGEVSLISGLRHRLMAFHGGLDEGGTALSLVRALTIGDRSAIVPEQWDRLRATGTSHLMAISGLHISLVAAMVFWLASHAWRRCGRLTERIPARKAAAMFSIVAAVLYALLAGFSIPTRRAVIMVSVMMLAVASGRYSSLQQVLCLAVFATLLIDPLSVLAAGWWLSFWAVTVIAWLISGRVGREGLAQKWVFMHVVLAISMFPMSLLFFQQASLIAPLANIVAVPWVGMLVVPLAMLGTLLFTVSEDAAGLLFRLSAWLLDLVWPWLDWLADLQFASWNQHQPDPWTLLPALAGLALLFVPRGIPGRWLGVLLLLPLFAITPARPDPGAARITLLDVGQGLAAVVQTRRHTLVYDTGPGFGPAFDAGRSVLVPFLRQQGVRALDTLVISHGDHDHIGGAASLLSAYPAARIISSVPEKLPGTAVRHCRQGQRWSWDGVEFLMLHPGPEAGLAGNNASCVLRVEAAGGYRLLLTGDIERAAEYRLLRNHADALPAEVLVVPHHGSKTSSLPAFIRAVAPGIAVFPAGHLNRFRFPDRHIVARYVAAGATLYQTGESGAVGIDLAADSTDPVISLYREVHPRYWSPAD